MTEYVGGKCTKKYHTYARNCLHSHTTHTHTRQNLGYVGPYPVICLILVKKHVPDESDMKHCLLFIVNIAVSLRQQDSLLTIRDRLHVSKSDFPLFSCLSHHVYMCVIFSIIRVHEDNSVFLTVRVPFNLYKCFKKPLSSWTLATRPTAELS